MNIALDISQIVHQGTGVARFTEGLVNVILDHDHTNQWLFFFSSLRQSLDNELENKIKKRGHRLVKWKIPPTLLSFFWNDLHKFKILNLKFKINPDWFITSDWIEPPLSINKATIVHDLTYLRYPETVNKTILNNQTLRLNWVKKESKIIFADSQTTKTDLLKYLNIESKKIIVNYAGIEIIKTTIEQIQQTRNKYKLKNPFILTVGKIEPRKNFHRLIEAFNKLINKNIDLIIVGPPGWQSSNNLTIQPSNHIRLLGLVDDDELFSLYSASTAFIFPSLWEGFGYPLVEAMSIGTPIACSKITPFEEIAQDSAIYFNPTKTEEITTAINKIVNNNHLRKKLIEDGKIRAKQFSWERYYNTLIKTLSIS